MRVYKSTEEKIDPEEILESGLDNEEVKDTDILTKVSDAMEAYTKVLNEFLKKCIEENKFYAFSVGLKMLKEFKSSNQDAFDCLKKSAKKE